MKRRLNKNKGLGSKITQRNCILFQETWCYAQFCPGDFLLNPVAHLRVSLASLAIWGSSRRDKKKDGDGVTDR